MFRFIIRIMFLFVSFFLLSFSIAGQDAKQPLTWDDDVQLQKEHIAEIDKLKADNRYVPYSGQSEYAVFFDKVLQNSYFYPEKKAALSVKEGKSVNNGLSYLDVSLPKGEYTGVGLLLSGPVNLSDSFIRDTAYIHFYIKQGTDVNNLKLALVQNLKPRIESVLELSKFVKSSEKGWQEVKIPIRQFPKVGSCYDMEKQKTIDGYINFNDVIEVKFFYSEPKDKPTAFLLDQVKILYDGVKKMTFLPVFKDSLSDLSYISTFPERTSKIKESGAVKNSGTKSLMIELDPKYASGAALGIAPFNIIKNRDKLSLEFSIKGKNSGEIVDIGLADDEQNDKQKGVTVLSLKKYILMTKDWQKVSIPLGDFSDSGKFWNGKEEMDTPFQFNKVVEILFRSNAGDNKECVFYVDDMRIRYNE